MPKLFCFLRDHPLLGMLSSVSGVLQTFIETTTPVLQFSGLLIGVLIGLVTLAAKWRDLRRSR